MTGNHTQHRRDRPVLQRMQVDDFDRGVEQYTPAPLLCGATQRNLFVIQKEVLVHPAYLIEHPHVCEHARACYPRNGSGLDSPTGLVFATGAWY